MGISDNICKLLESIYIQKSNHIFFLPKLPKAQL